MTVLRLSDIGLSLGDIAVLESVSMHVAKGEFVSIVGPSGAGKSTLFRLLIGALTPDRGSIRIDSGAGHVAGDGFAFMPQRDALLPWRRVLDNVTLGLEMQGQSRANAREQARPLLAEFGLEGFERHYPKQLSGGMRQRAALLRTVIQARPIQLLDEPFGALDALTRMQMQAWLEERWLEARWTTLLITHDVREAAALSDRIYVLSQRPARVIEEFEVNAPRPRLGRPLPDSMRALEDRLLDTLLTQTGVKP